MDLLVFVISSELLIVYLSSSFCLLLRLECQNLVLTSQRTKYILSCPMEAASTQCAVDSIVSRLQVSGQRNER